jgi:hypothetical protein
LKASQFLFPIYYLKAKPRPEKKKKFFCVLLLVFASLFFFFFLSYFNNMENFEQGLFRFKVHNYKSNNEPVVLSDHNETTRFDGRTDEEYINSSIHQTNLSIEELISNPKPKRKSKEGKIPRRLNMWIIYRRDKNARPEFKGLKAAIVTKIIREMWDKEPESVKEFYETLSRLAVKNHIKQFGHDYKYRPGPYKKSKSKRGKQRKERSERKSPPSSVESSPNISELTDTFSQFFPTPPFESMQDSPILSDTTSELQLPTPESDSHSPTSLLEPSEFMELELFPHLNTISPKPNNQELLSAQNLTREFSELEKLLYIDQELLTYLSAEGISGTTNDNQNDWLDQIEEISNTTMNFNGHSDLLNQEPLYIDCVNDINLQNGNDINGQLFTNPINGIDEHLLQEFQEYIQQNPIEFYPDQSHLDQMDFDNLSFPLFNENSDHFDFTRQPSQ